MSTVKRVVIYKRQPDDKWDNDIVAYADVQIHFPPGELAAIKFISLQVNEDFELDVVMPSTEFGGKLHPVIKGRQLQAILQTTVSQTFTKIEQAGAKEGETWERTKDADGTFYIGVARKEYSNSVYHSKGK